MGNDKKFIIDGYRFASKEGYEDAVKEMNQVIDIKKKNDLKEEASLRKIYDRLVENKAFKTPIGIGFLRESQRKLLQNPDQKKTMKAIPITSDSTPHLTLEDQKNFEYKSLYEFHLHKLRNLRIVIAFLILIILVLFSVTVFDRTLTPEKARESVLNEYAAWKEDLVEKENELRRREKALELKENQKLEKDKASTSSFGE